MKPSVSFKRLAKKPKASATLRKALTKFRPKIRSRHPSHKCLRLQLPVLSFRSVIRLGSTTVLPDVYPAGKRIECNTVEAIKNSASKFRMKQCFRDKGVLTARWCKASDPITVTAAGITPGGNGNVPLKFPIIAKLNFGSRGTGMQLLETQAEFNAFLTAKRSRLSEYLFEEYKSFSREYRLHVSEEGCFYTCRKMLKSETPDDKRYYRNDSNCIWIVETNPDFNKPTNWNAIVTECVKAMKAVGLDFGACDVRVQGRKNGENRANPEFIIVEINSAPSFGEGTAAKYIEILPKILDRKARFANII